MGRPADDLPVLSQRALNRALLARQLLLERARTTIPRALERVAGIQAQYAPSMYLGLWSRLEGFERDALTRALERRTAVVGTLMRETIHLVSARDYWPFALGVREARRQWWTRVRPEHASPKEVAARARLLRRRLASGPLQRKELEQVVGKGHEIGVGLWTDLVRVPPSSTWERRRADLYAAAEEWIGPPEVTAEEGIRHLVRRYLGGFGPAPRKDIAGFCGLPAKDVAAAIEGLPLRRFRDEAGRELLDLPRAPLPDPETPAPVRFLPTWDSTLLVHARRTQILPEPYRPLVFNTRTPHSMSTFLVDGAVAGSWRYERGRIEMEPFRRLDRSVQRELRAEVDGLTSFHE